MAEEKKNWLGPYIPEGSWIREIIQQAKLAYYLMLDPRVNPLTKLIPLAALAYLVMPVDISPDFVPVLGQIDDVGILMLGLRFFFPVMSIATLVAFYFLVRQLVSATAALFGLALFAAAWWPSLRSSLPAEGSIYSVIFAFFLNSTMYASIAFSLFSFRNAARICSLTMARGIFFPSRTIDAECSA